MTCTARIARATRTRLLLTTWLVLGSTAPRAALAEEPTDTRDGEVTTYHFEDDLVGGDVMRPDGEVLHVRRRKDRESLIRIREHFIVELLQSGEQI